VSSTIVFNLDGTGSDWQELTSFGRYLRLLGSAGADGTAIVQVDWIGKE
jgi:hypothetical protein